MATATAVQSQTPTEAAQSAVAAATKAAAEANSRVSFFAQQQHNLQQQVSVLREKYDAACKSFASGDGADPSSARDTLAQAESRLHGTGQLLSEWQQKAAPLAVKLQRAELELAHRLATDELTDLLQRELEAKNAGIAAVAGGDAGCGSTAKPFSSSAWAERSFGDRERIAGRTVKICKGGNSWRSFRFAPGLASDCSGIPYTPASVTLDTPAPKPVTPPEPDKPFRFAPDSTRKSPSIDVDTFDHAGLGGFEKTHHDDDGCGCDGSCSDCAKKAASLYFAPGTRIRHKLTNKIYTWSRPPASRRTIACAC